MKEKERSFNAVQNNTSLKQFIEASSVRISF